MKTNKNFEPNDNFHFYLYFMEERMKIFYNRKNGAEQPYSEDPIFQAHKFTNVYRSLDRVSQFLLSNVIYTEDEFDDIDMFWRILLFKHFNKIETWKAMVAHFGTIDLNISKKALVEFFKEYTEKGIPVYSNAFMLTAPFMRQPDFMNEFGLKSGSPKYDIYLSIFYKHFIERGNIEKVLSSGSLKELFENLSKTPSFANFLSMQFTIDLNYSELFNFDENDFIVASVGSQRGIERTFTLHKPTCHDEVIYWVKENFDELCEQYGHEFTGLPNRQPSLMDLQNCFCETDKYMRGIGAVTEGKEIKGTRIKTKFEQHPSQIETFVFPPKWNVNLK